MHREHRELKENKQEYVPSKITGTRKMNITNLPNKELKTS